MNTRPPRHIPAVLALFAALALSVSARADTLYIDVQWGGAGSVSPSGSFAIERGGSQTFTFTASGCDAVQDVQVDDASVGVLSSYTFTDVQSDHVLYVAFGPPPASVSLSAAPAAGVCTVPDTLTASVPGASQVAVRFYDGSMLLGSAALDNAGICRLVVSPPLGPGTHTLKAQFDGSACMQSSQSAPLDYVVQDASNAAPTLIIALQIFDGPYVGEYFNIITRLRANGQTLPWINSGTIEFYEDATFITNAGITQGAAYLTYRPTTVGTHVYSARFTGNDCLPPMTSQGAPVVVRASCGVSLTSNLNPSLPGQAVTVTATACSPAASGTVEFRDNDATGQNLLGTVPLVNGTAQITHSFSLGLHDVFVYYSGDSLFVGGAGGNYQQKVDAPVSAAIERFEAGREAGSVRLVWALAPSLNVASVELQRAGAEPGPWLTLDAAVEERDGGFTAVDAGASPDRAWYYRISARLADGATIESQMLRVGATAAVVRDGIRLVSANPAPAVSVEFALAHESAVRLSVVDITGREIARLAEGSYAAGSHVATFGAAGRRTVTPGIYFIRFVTPERVETKRVAIVP